jgi:hypothetical protein
MPEFHFSLRRIGQPLREAGSLDGATLDAAREEAIRSAREILMNAVAAGSDDVPESIIVSDDAGREVFAIRLIDVVPPSLLP